MEKFSEPNFLEAFLCRSPLPKISESGSQKGRSKIFWTKKNFGNDLSACRCPNLGLRQGASKIFGPAKFFQEALSQLAQLEHGRVRPYDSAMPDADEMAELLIAAHGLDDALHEACERLLALEKIGDHAGAEMWSRVASIVWGTISAWMAAADASGVMH